MLIFMAIALEPIYEDSKRVSLLLPEIEEGNCCEVVAAAGVELGGEGSRELGKRINGVRGQTHEPFQGEASKCH